MIIPVFRGLRGVPYQPYDGERIRCTARDFGSLAIAGRMYLACAGKLGELVIKPRIAKYRAMQERALAGQAHDIAGYAQETIDALEVKRATLDEIEEIHNRK